MAKKRFTDCDKWQDEWFSELKPEYKLAWLYILDTCTNAGRWKKNFKALNFFCGTNITEQNFKEVFKDRIIEQEGFYFIPKFLKFQYPNGLNSNKKALISVVNELKEYNLLEIVNQTFGDDFIIIDNKKSIKKQRKSNKSLIDKGLITNQSGIYKVSIQEKEKEKDQEKDKDKDKDQGDNNKKGGNDNNQDNSKTKHFKKPSVDEIRSYCQERNNGIDAEQFFNFYESKGWLVGKSPMKDWRACVRTWEKNRFTNNSGVANSKAGWTKTYDRDLDLIEEAVREREGR